MKMLDYEFLGEDAGKALAHAEKRCRFGCARCTKERAAKRREARLAELLEHSLNRRRKIPARSRRMTR